MLDQLDSLAGNCGLSLPTLFERIGSMAAHGQHRPRDFTPRGYSACGDPSLPGTPATRNAGPEVPARPPVKTTANSIASRTGQRLGNRDTDGEAKGFTGPITDQAHAANRRVQRGPLAKTTPISLASGPARALSRAHGFDNWKRRGIDKPSREPTAEATDRRVLPNRRHSRREPMTARASPID